MVLERQSLDLLANALQTLDAGFNHLPNLETSVDSTAIATVLEETAQRLQNNFPYPHPLYAGQMLKPPHPVARLAYAMSLWINPNNHALDGGRASSIMEKEAVAEIAGMFAWDQPLGHLCGGGTMANLEALWIAGRLHPGEKILASDQAHYTHSRITEALRLGFVPVPTDARGRMDLTALESLLKEHPVGTVVATLGTTGLGAVDPLPGILKLQQRFGFRIHADTAYGGYFTLVDNLRPDTRAAFDCLSQVDSIVIDPHKHGLQPYGCGCVLFRDPSVGGIYKHDSPYTYFSSEELHLGEISLECSRAGASAVALWATQKLLPLNPGGSFAQNLACCHKAALALFQRLKQDSRWLTLFPPELDIVVWAPQATHASSISQASKQCFSDAAEANLHLALITLPATLVKPYWPDLQFDQETVTCLRSCLMKPEHLDWLDKIWEILDQVIDPIGN